MSTTVSWLVAVTSGFLQNCEAASTLVNSVMFFYSIIFVLHFKAHYVDKSFNRMKLHDDQQKSLCNILHFGTIPFPLYHRVNRQRSFQP